MAQRFEDHFLRIYVDDVEYGPLSVLNFRARPEVRIDSATYMGKSDPHKDSSSDGWGLSISLERNAGDGDLVKAYERHERGRRRKDGTGRTEFVLGSRLNGVESEVHRFFGAQWTLEQSGSDKSRTSYSVEAQCERRERI